MATMRQVRKEETIEFKPKQGFVVEIPESLMQALQRAEASERQHSLQMWEHFRSAAGPVCASRYTLFMNKRHRKTAFRAQMSKLCEEFSRRSVNLKIRFKATPRFNDPTGKKENYFLRFALLTDVPESALNAPYFTAEIPQIPDRESSVRAFGEYVSNFQLVVEQISEELVLSNDESESSASTIYLGDENRVDDNNAGNAGHRPRAPMATAVAVAAPTVAHDEAAHIPTVLATATST